jgi:hypothetical protein
MPHLTSPGVLDRLLTRDVSSTAVTFLSKGMLIEI